MLKKTWGDSLSCDRRILTSAVTYLSFFISPKIICKFFIRFQFFRCKPQLHFRRDKYLIKSYRLTVQKQSFFSAVRAFSQKFGVTQHTQHRLYSHNTFFLKMSPIPERSRLKTSTALTVSYNLLHPGSPTSPPTIRLHSLLSFTHSLASAMVSSPSLKQPFTPSIHLLLGLPLPLLPSTSARYINIK